MGREDGSDRIELVARRVDYLEVMAGTPRRKSDLVDALGHSRSTVDRAVSDLVDAGLVERGDDGYVTTVAGRLAAERYRAFLADEQDLLAAQDVLEQLPPSCEIPDDVLASASVVTDGDEWLADRVDELLSATDHYRAVLPRGVEPRHLQLCQRHVEQSELTATVLVTPDALDRCRETVPRLTGSEGLTVRQVPEAPYGLVIADGVDDSTTVAVLTYDADGLAGVVRNDTEAAVGWAREQFEVLAAGTRDAMGDPE